MSPFVHLTEETDKMISGFEQKEDFAGIVFNRNFPPENISVLLDKTLYEESLFSILENAKHAMDGKGETEIRISGEGYKYERISVIDKGCGMDKERFIRPNGPVKAPVSGWLKHFQI